MEPSIHGDWLILQAISQRIARIEFHVRNGRNAFIRDITVQDAVELNFVAIAAKTQALSSALRRFYNQVPWEKMIHLETLLLSQNEIVDPYEVWVVIHQDLPLWKKAVIAILDELEDQL